MQTLNAGVDFGQWKRRIAGARERVLMLDYDGTLAPFRVERDQAVPYPGVREARKLRSDCGTSASPH